MLFALTVCQLLQWLEVKCQVLHFIGVFLLLSFGGALNNLRIFGK